MNQKHSQMTLPNFPVRQEKTNRQINKLNEKDRKFHDWYRFVLSFPPHLVRNYLDDFKLDHNHEVLDPYNSSIMAVTYLLSKKLSVRIK